MHFMQVCILNYTKDKKPFYNQLCLSPISDQHGVAYYVGIQSNVTGAVLLYRSQMYSPFQMTPAGTATHFAFPSFLHCQRVFSHMFDTPRGICCTNTQKQASKTCTCKENLLSEDYVLYHFKSKQPCSLCSFWAHIKQFSVKLN